jgi:hypothetical protein
MGQLDYLAAGKNSPELKFTNQQNFFGTGTNLERGTDGGDPAAGRNTLYAAAAMTLSKAVKATTNSPVVPVTMTLCFSW